MQKISLINKKIYPNYLNLHHDYHTFLRQQLQTQQYQEMWCPPLSTSPCFETHVHPFEIHSLKDKRPLGYYLHTSPEFILKNHLLKLETFSSTGIYNLNYVFRDDTPGPIHRQQFIMLEFYRLKSPVHHLLNDLTQLISNSSYMIAEKYECLEIKHFDIITVEELFQQYLQFSILDYLVAEELFKKISRDFKQYAPPKVLDWDDLFHLLWLNEIEPHLNKHSALIVKDFPSPLGLLAKTSAIDSRVNLRFEVFINGHEIANGYAEESSYEKNNLAIQLHLEGKKNHYNYDLIPPSFLLNSLKEKTLPICYGVAMGTERLLQVLTKAQSAFIDFE